MSYAIRQTYVNHSTGERWTKVLKKRWKTFRGAQKAASSIAYSWVCMPDGKNRTEESQAEVLNADAVGFQGGASYHFGGETSLYV